MLVVGSAIGSLVARLRDAEEASRDRERRTSALLAFTRDAAAAADVDGVCAAVVAHVREVAGMTCTVLPGTDPLHGVQIRIADDRALTPEQHQFVEAVARQAGVAVGRLQLAAAARDAALRAKAEELRSTLLSTVSHDLRTPLAVITGMATSLRDEAETGARREALDTIVDEAERLSRILTNLLSITKVESGAAPRCEWVPVEELVGTALRRLDLALATHPVVVDVPTTALAHVDPILVEQLLINLIDNAAKHTPAGTPIEVRASRDATATPGATIEVLDRGPGLPPGPPRQVFDKFFRGEQAAAGGVGLGLAVCRGIALAHHGTIDAIRRDGGGASFRAWFPDDGHPPNVELEERQAG
jgi:two-component system sensor histidine kinase KdpD